MTPHDSHSNHGWGGLTQRWQTSVAGRTGRRWARSGTRVASDLPPIEEQLAQLAEDLDQADDVAQALQAVTLTALLVVDGAEFAGITLRRPGPRWESAAPTSPRVVSAEVLQYDLDEGPCLEVADGRFMVLANDVAHDRRWPSWGTAISRTVASVLSVQLGSGRGVHGAINVYSSRPYAFSHGSQLAAAALSVHASVLLHSVSLGQDVRGGKENHAVIGQAQGILMHRFGIDPEAALAVLHGWSNRHNLHLAEVAALLITDPDMNLDPPSKD